MKLSTGLRKLERYLATESVIDPKEVKERLEAAIEKAKELEG